MQIDDQPGVLLSVTPRIDPAHPLAATLTLATAQQRPRYLLTRPLLEDLARAIVFELDQAPVPDDRRAVEQPFGLKRSTLPRVRAEAGHAVVTLELTSLRDPADKLHIDVCLPADIAQTLGFELLEAARKLG